MIKRIPALLIGDLQAAAAVNDHGMTYIAVAPIADDADDRSVTMDEIEARALCTWLATSLGFTLTQESNS